jgi:Protein of unknown function (DUF3617)
MRAIAYAMLVAWPLFAVSAHAADAPKRKSGLWEITIPSAAAQGGHTMQQCIDEKTDSMIMGSMGARMQQKCSKQTFGTQGDKLVIDSVCQFGPTATTTHAVITGKLDSSYRVDSRSTYDPPLMGMKEATSTIQAKWLGPCTADMKPGDMIMPGGMKMNINSMPGMQK